MFSRILVGYLDNEQGHDALELGRILAQAGGADLLVFTASTENGGGLSELARSEGADLVVLGSTHRGSLGRVVPGATVGHLLGEAPCAVAVAPPGFGRRNDGDLGWRPLSGDTDDAGMRVIGVGFDGSTAAQGALDLATELALKAGAALRVYAVARKYATPPGADASGHVPGIPSEAEVLREQLHEAVACLPTEVRALPVFMRGAAAFELTRAIELGVDLLVLGSRPGGPMRRALHASVSSAVLLEARCPVLISPGRVSAPQAVGV
ncbi:MAG TPA: universal stress protein [Solirubrobacterales bacterium]|nr:universal stress protein [Solirubrobacterales bacterium]